MTETRGCLIESTQYTGYVANYAELQQVLGLLSPESKNARRELVSLTHILTKANLTFGAMGVEAVLLFQASLDPPYLTSCGDPTREGIEVFYFDNQWTELSRKYFIPWSIAEPAIVRFIDTGEQDPKVIWMEV